MKLTWEFVLKAVALFATVVAGYAVTQARVEDMQGRVERLESGAGAQAVMVEKRLGELTAEVRVLAAEVRELRAELGKRGAKDAKLLIYRHGENLRAVSE